MITRYVLFWFALVMIAIGNGALREGTYGRSISDLKAHQLSTLTGIILTGIAVWSLNHFWPLGTARQAWTIGVLWLLMTVGFEFIFGHFIAGHPWGQLFADYNILAGRVWPVFLIWVTVMPYVFFRLQ
jgi:hypothetical protein